MSQHFSTNICPNCGHVFHGPWTVCPKCGDATYKKPWLSPQVVFGLIMLGLSVGVVLLLSLFFS